MQNFNAFGLPAVLLQSLEQMGITVPTPIQVEAIPTVLAGSDLLASAQTGTGKTIAYLLPIISKLDENPDDSVLILTPTRELAAQVRDSALQFIKRIRSLNMALLIGGEPIFKQFAALKRNPRIIIGTPGRIIDHLQRRTLNLQSVKFLVLDETDRMLDMGFSQDIEMIVENLKSDRQTLLFSATLPQAIVKLSKKYLAEDAKRIAIGSTTEPSRQIKQETVQVSSGNKLATLVTALEEREGSVIIFVKTKISADRLAEKLQEKGHAADAIHGDLNQRQRDRVIREFRNSKCRILVATDIAARGLDIPHIMHVINYDLPQCPEDYIHRIGRTGRAGMTGFALSFVAPEERHKWKAIHRLIHTGEETESEYRRGGNSRSGARDGGRSRGGYQGQRDGGAARGGYRGGDRSGSSESRGYRGRSDNAAGASSESRGGYRGRSDNAAGAPSESRGYRGRSENAGAPSESRGYRGRSENAGAPSESRGYRGRSENAGAPSESRGYRGRSENAGAPSESRGYRGRSENAGAPSESRGYRGRSENAGAPSESRGYRGRSENAGAPSESRGYRGRSENAGAPSESRGYRGRSENAGASESRGYRGRSENAGASESRGYRGRSENTASSEPRVYRKREETGSTEAKTFRGKREEGRTTREYVNPKLAAGAVSDKPKRTLDPRIAPPATAFAKRVVKKRATAVYSGAVKATSANDVV